MWVSTKESARILGKSMRTVQRQIKSGKLESREVPGIGGNGLVFEVHLVETQKITSVRASKELMQSIEKNKTITKFKTIS